VKSRIQFQMGERQHQVNTTGSGSPQYQTKNITTRRKEKLFLTQSGIRLEQNPKRVNSTQCGLLKEKLCYGGVNGWSNPRRRRARREDGDDHNTDTERTHRVYGESTMKYQVSKIGT
jgi:hypothetical protein